MSPIIILPDLFHAGISQSGTALCTWALAPKGEGIDHGRKLARIFNCPTNNNMDMVECLRKVEPLEMISKDNIFMASPKIFYRSIDNCYRIIFLFLEMGY